MTTRRTGERVVLPFNVAFGFCTNCRNGQSTFCLTVNPPGYQATAAAGEQQPALNLDQLVDTVRSTGSIGVVGLYLPSDPGAPNEHAAKGELLFRVGRFFEKGQKMGTGQADAKQYAHQLRDLIITGRVTPSFVASQNLSR